MFHEATMLFIAATVVGCHTYVASVMFTTPLFELGRACAAVAPRAATNATTTAARRSFLICVPLFLLWMHPGVLVGDGGLRLSP